MGMGMGMEGGTGNREYESLLLSNGFKVAQIYEMDFHQHHIAHY